MTTNIKKTHVLLSKVFVFTHVLKCTLLLFQPATPQNNDLNTFLLYFRPYISRRKRRKKSSNTNPIWFHCFKLCKEGFNLRLCHWSRRKDLKIEDCFECIFFVCVYWAFPFYCMTKSFALFSYIRCQFIYIIFLTLLSCFYPNRVTNHFVCAHGEYFPLFVSESLFDVCFFNFLFCSLENRAICV